jgi:hypothetical protein
MEDKTPKNQDDELKSESTGENQEDSEDFGLPETSADSDLDAGAESEPLSGMDDSDSELFNGSATDDELEDSDVYKYHTTHDDDRKRNPVGLIISFVLIGIIVIAIAVYWFFFREPPQKQIVQMPVTEEVEEPTVVEEEPVQQDAAPETPVVEEETEPAQPTETFAAVEEGSFEAINAPTGRYYIVLNSFLDEDLAKDYAQNLAMEGVDTKIIPPSEAKKGFNRVVLSNEYSTWQSAEASLRELKGIFGESIWVLRY